MSEVVAKGEGADASSNASRPALNLVEHLTTNYRVLVTASDRSGTLRQVPEACRTRRQRSWTARTPRPRLGNTAPSPQGLPSLKLDCGHPFRQLSGRTKAEDTDPNPPAYLQEASTLSGSQAVVAESEPDSHGFCTPTARARFMRRRYDGDLRAKQALSRPRPSFQ
ncbi:hypothetical protein L227DRAFT_89920 [Lentinus tigrinus ALCF2SS1-6]|uniref:Uncharacterized protein n=1 Tax=Lentinus tigrinus ALCF2SS1-6 TaxID=1328759 RepID=A0A5C2S9K9_9APHY|nr:hypothetical protein L227DRAFT_89920 [Lentinus tigrinus ALCF2SS1-6]